MTQSDTTHARVRISLQTGEFEVEGSETFVATFQDTLEAMTERVVTVTPQLLQSAPGGNTLNSGANGSQELSTQFPEALHGLPKGASGTDQILVAGHFSTGSDGTFVTGDANRLLIEQGIKLSNPSQSLKNNLTAKRVFKVGNRFKISKTGEEHLGSLIGRS